MVEYRPYMDSRWPSPCYDISGACSIDLGVNGYRQITHFRPGVSEEQINQDSGLR
jgi:hypothetical protein